MKPAWLSAVTVLIGLAIGLVVGLTFGGGTASTALWGLLGVVVGSAVTIWAEQWRSSESRAQRQAELELAAVTELTSAVEAYEDAFGPIMAKRWGAWKQGAPYPKPPDFDSDEGVQLAASQRRVRVAAGLPADEKLRERATEWAQASIEIMWIVPEGAYTDDPDLPLAAQIDKRNMLNEELFDDLARATRDLRSQV